MEKRDSKEIYYYVPDTMEREIINHLDLNILVGGISRGNEGLEFFHPFRSDPFYRFYYPTEGQVELACIDGRFMLHTGCMYLIPANLPFRYLSHGKFSHYWLHFCSSQLRKLPHFQHLIELPAQSTTKRLMHDFVQLLKIGKGIRTLLELDIILRQILLPFLETQPTNTNDYEQIQRLDQFSVVIDYIERHLPQPMTIPQLSALLQMNRNDFSAEFHRTFGVPPKQYICQCRINQAKILLLTTELPIKQISDAVGYDNEFFFYRLFRKYTGVTPSQFRDNSNLGY